MPTYTWRTVPSIKGKLGTITLTQVASAHLNDGDPVTGASSSYMLILSDQSNCKNMLLTVAVDESEVLVKYRIPQDTYEYIKLVYKEDYEPENLADGTVIDLNQDTSQVVINSILTSGTYYFKIFTNNGNSNTARLVYVGIIPIIISVERVW